MRDPQNLAVSPRTSKTAYDLAAPFYDNWKWQRFWRKYEYPIIRSKIDELARHISSEMSVLDLGCGTGWYLDAISDLTSDVRGVDISEGMLKIARGRLGQGRVSLADIRISSLQPNRYDAILATRVLSHIQNTDRVFDQIKSAIKPFGILIISDVDPLHNYKFTKLPFFDRSIFAETFKHTRSSIDESLTSRGFIFESGHSISMDGHSHELLNANADVLDNPAGWVGCWRQLRKARERKRFFSGTRKVLAVESTGVINSFSRISKYK